MKKLMSGNEALSRGAYEAGVKIATAYPGTPSTEILETLMEYKDVIYGEWAPNEKVAVEVAIGASIGGARVLCAMKHVGVNVAADPIFTYAYQGVNGGFVLVSGDDPSMHSSQNEQDNRNYARFAKMILIEPSDSQECKDFMMDAYELSEKFDMPVMFRTSTRICHSKGLVELGERVDIEVKPYVKNAAKFVCTPANAQKARPLLEQKIEAVRAYAGKTRLNTIEDNKTKIGIVTCASAYLYAKEVFGNTASYLKLGLTNPLNMEYIKSFTDKYETVYVIEELEPFMEEQMKAAGIKCIGKELVPSMFELNPQILEKCLLGKEAVITKPDIDVVARPPVLCAGCPHRGFFYVAAKKKLTVTGDIGCYTLGAASPLSALDTVVCMGGGFSVGMGISKAFQQAGRNEKVFGVVGDSTFFHSGITGAIDILYNKGNMVPVVLDNSITGMTGHQENPGTGKTLMGEPTPIIDPVTVLKALGYATVAVVDPCDLSEVDRILEEAKASTDSYAIVTKRPCVLIKGLKKSTVKCRVISEKCKKCKICLKVGCPAIVFKGDSSYIDETMCVGCEVCKQVCKFDAIEKVGE